MFTLIDDTIYYRTRSIERLTPARRALAFTACTGASPALAAAVAAGAFGSGPSVVAVARRWGLLRVDTDDARARGLLQ